MPSVTLTSNRHPVRSTVRTTLFGVSLAEVTGSYFMRRLRLSGGRSLNARERAGWLHDAASTVLSRMGVAVSAEGEPPLHGLVVSNHLSYLDVLAYASLFPCLFVAKKDVLEWPVFGHFATMAGTIYVDRERHAANTGAAAAVGEALAAGVPVVLFAEGTSTDGTSMLPFRPSFFEPAVRAGACVTAAAIAYQSASAPEPTLAYHGDDIFAPHLVRTLGHRNVQASVAFAAAGRHYADRKQAVRATQAEAEMLRGILTGRHPAKRRVPGEVGSDVLDLHRAV